MNYEYEQNKFSKSILAGLFTGIIAVVANLLYNFVYRNVTSFSLSWIINVSAVIFVSFILCLIAGIIFYIIVPYLQKKSALYIVLFAVLTIVTIIAGFAIQRSPDALITRQFRGLYFGDVLILGICCTFLVPWFARLKNSFF